MRYLIIKTKPKYELDVQRQNTNGRFPEIQEIVAWSQSA